MRAFIDKEEIGPGVADPGTAALLVGEDNLSDAQPDAEGCSPPACR